MTRRLIFILSLLLPIFVSCGPAKAAAVSGSVTDLVGHTVDPSTFVRFDLKNCSGIPRIANTSAVAGTSKDFYVNGSGQIVGQIAGNDAIVCTVQGNTYYTVTVWSLGTTLYSNDYFVSGSSFNLNTATPRSSAPTAIVSGNTFQQGDILIAPTPNVVGSFHGNASPTQKFLAMSGDGTKPTTWTWVDISSLVGSGGGATSTDGLTDGQTIVKNNQANVLISQLDPVAAPIAGSVTLYSGLTDHNLKILNDLGTTNVMVTPVVPAPHRVLTGIASDGTVSSVQLTISDILGYVDSSNASTLISGILDPARTPAETGDVSKPQGQSTTTVNMVGGQSAANVAAVSQAYQSADQPTGLPTLGLDGKLRTQEIPAFTGDVNSSGLTLTMNPSGVLPGTYTQVTVNAKGVVTNAGQATAPVPAVATSTVPGIIRPSTGLSLASDGTTTVLFGTTPGTVMRGDDSRVSNALQSTASYSDPSWLTHLSTSKLVGPIPTGSMPAFSGDISSPAGGTVLTLPAIATPGTFPKVTFNAKGQVTGGAPLTMSDLPALSSSNLTDSATLIHTSTVVNADLTGTFASLVVSRINGTSIPTNSTADMFLGTTAPGIGSWISIPNCTYVGYSTSSHSFSCSAAAGGGGSGVTAFAPATHRFINQVNADGTFQAAQPDYSDLTNPPSLSPVATNGLSTSLVDSSNLLRIAQRTGTGTKVLSGTGVYTSGHAVFISANGDVIDYGSAPVQIVNDLTDAATVVRTSQLAVTTSDKLPTLVAAGVTPGRGLMVSSGGEIQDTGSVPVLPGTPCSAGSHVSGFSATTGLPQCTPDTSGSTGTVTHTGGSLTLNALVAGNSNADLKASTITTDSSGNLNVPATVTANVVTAPTLNVTLEATATSANTTSGAPTVIFKNITDHSARLRWSEALCGTEPGTANAGSDFCLSGYNDAGTPSTALTALRVYRTDGSIAIANNMTVGGSTLNLHSLPFIFPSSLAAGYVYRDASGNISTSTPASSGIPGGASTAIQYSTGTAFGGDAANFSYNSTTHMVTATGGLASSSSNAGNLQLVQGSAPSSFAANSFALLAPPSIAAAYHWQVPGADGSGLLSVTADQLSLLSGAKGTQVVSNGTGYVAALGEVPASAFGIICDGTTDTTTAMNAAQTAGYSIRFPGFSTCVITQWRPQNNTHWSGDSTVILHKSTDTAEPFFALSGAQNITFEGLIFDNNGVNIGSLTGGNATASTTLLQVSGGSGFRPNWFIPIVSSGGGCTWSITGYITTNSSGVPSTPNLYSPGAGCTSLPTMGLVDKGATISGRGYENSYVAPTLTWSGSAAIKPSAGGLDKMTFWHAFKIKFLSCRFRSTGSVLQDMTQNAGFEISAGESDISLIDSTIENTVTGSHIFSSSGANAASNLYLRNFSSNGAYGNAVYITGGAGTWDLAGGTISNTADGEATAGQSGNAIIAFQTNHALIHGFRIVNPRISGVRVSGNSSNYNHVYNNTISGNGEVAVWTEVGAEWNTVEGNMIDHCNSGIMDDNAHSQPHSGKNFILNNHINGCQAIGISAIHTDVLNNTVTDTPVPFKIGYGGSGGYNNVRGNTCTASPVASNPIGHEPICFLVDRFSQQPSTISGNFQDGPTYGRVDVEFSFGLMINGVTAASPAVISYNPNVDTGESPVVGDTYMLMGIYGMISPGGTSINGSLCGVTAINTTTHTLTCGGVTNVPALNTTGYTAYQYATPPNGDSSLIHLFTGGSDATPVWSKPAIVNSDNMFK